MGKSSSKMDRCDCSARVSLGRTGECQSDQLTVSIELLWATKKATHWVALAAIPVLSAIYAELLRARTDVVKSRAASVGPVFRVRSDAPASAMFSVRVLV